MDLLARQVETDFSKARSKAFFRHLANLIVGKPTLLVPFHLVQKSLAIKSQTYRGVKPVAIDKIIGSVDRYQDFDDEFLPTDDNTASRWKSIDLAYRLDVNLPPVSLYKIGEVYFVVDGNHRISVAKEMGVKFIDAEIIEFSTNVKIDANTDLKALILKAEYSHFLSQTELDRHPLDGEIEFTIPGRYNFLLEHISVHRYFKGIDENRPVSLPEAAFSWYSHLYFPMIAIFRRHEIMKKFPHRTEADLYLWVTTHRYFLMEKFGPEINIEHAVLDFAEKYQINPIDSFLESLGLKKVAYSTPG